MTINTINDLKPDPNNANRGTERGHRIVNNSIQRHGAGRSGLAARDGTMIAGSQTLEEMAALGMKIKPVHTTGDEWVVVIRDDVEPGSEQATLMGLEDNRGAQEGIEWDPGILAELAQQFDVSGLFTGDELAEWAQPSEPEAGAGGDEFDTTPDDGPTRAQLGDLWVIGGVHRLLVGDCTDPANVARLMGGERPVLMVTDPPYGVEYDPSWRKKAGINNSHGMMGKVENDGRVDWKDAYAVSNAQVAYVWHADRHARHVAENLDDAGYEIVAQIIWAKDRFALSRGDYHWQHEPCWYAVAKGRSHNWQGARNQSTLWEIARLSSNKDYSEEDVWGHGTQKPIECMQRPIENNTAQGDLTYDPFLGSGTTLIAAHRTGRRCYGCELAPKYADVILRRAEAENLTVELKERLGHQDAENVV